MRVLITLLLISACSEKRSVEPGLSKSALIELKGEPLHEQEIPSGEILTYERNERYQLTNGTVSSIFVNPEGDERHVLFWRHKFRECETTERELSEEAMPEVELACPQMGKSVVFIKGSGKVLRVSSYERP